MDDLKNFDPEGVGLDNGAYFGMPFAPEEAALVLVSAPWDVTVSYGAGTANAPDALIEASTQLDFYDPAAPNAWKRGIATAPIDYSLLETSQRLRNEAEKVIRHLEAGKSIDDERTQRHLHHINASCEAMNDKIFSQTNHWIAQQKIVGLVGGDHSTPYGFIRAVAQDPFRKNRPFGILHLDAHCDLRNAYEGFAYSHASVMFNVLRDVPQVEKLVQVGVRDYAQSEAVFADNDNRVVRHGARELAHAVFGGEAWQHVCKRIVHELPHDVYISFDIDALTPEHCPHTGTPVPGGLTYDQATYLLEMVADSGRRVIGFDVVEVTPHPTERIDAIVGARILYKLCLLALKTNV